MARLFDAYDTNFSKLQRTLILRRIWAIAKKKDYSLLVFKPESCIIDASKKNNVANKICKTLTVSKRVIHYSILAKH